MGRFSRDKGARFERWIARYFRDLGCSAVRTRQSAEYDDKADVEVTCGFVRYSIECKSRATMPSKALLSAWEQARAAAGDEKYPVVAIKLQGTSKALVVLDLDDFAELIP